MFTIIFTDKTKTVAKTTQRKLKYCNTLLLFLRINDGRAGAGYARHNPQRLYHESVGCN